MRTAPRRTIKQFVADVYTRIWDLFLTPIRWIAGIFLAQEWLPQYGPWMIGAYAGRWPEKVSDEELTQETKNSSAAY